MLYLIIIIYHSQDIELVFKEQFDAVLDTIGISETESLGVNLLKRGGHYMTLQVEVATNLICKIWKHISSFTGISIYEFTGTKSQKAFVLW